MFTRLVVPSGPTTLMAAVALASAMTPRAATAQISTSLIDQHRAAFERQSLDEDQKREGGTQPRESRRRVERPREVARIEAVPVATEDRELTARGRERRRVLYEHRAWSRRADRQHHVARVQRRAIGGWGAVAPVELLPAHRP